MTLSAKDIFVASMLAGLLLLAFLVIPNVGNVPAIDIPEPTNFETWEPSMQNLESWAEGAQVNLIVKQAANYNVDVKISSAHAWKHVGATEALRCLTRNGTWMILSEKETRNLHLLCYDKETGKSYVAIVAKILRYKDDATNATTFLYTAFQLVNESLETYMKYETQYKAIIVNLRFVAGELFFKPQ